MLQNCDIGGTTFTSGPVKYKAGFHSKNIKRFVSIFVCARMKGCMQRTVWMNQIIYESMLHVVGKAQYVEGVLQGAVGVDPVCMEGAFARADWDKPSLF